MTLEEALNIIDQILGQIQTSRIGHIKIQEAFDLISKSVKQGEKDGKNT